MSSVPPWRSSGSNSGTSSAYTAVTPTAISKPTPSSNDGDDENRSKTQWPESLRQFVGKCFDEVHPDDKQAMEQQLKETITKAFETKTTWAIDWSKMALPIIEARKKQAKNKNKKKKPDDFRLEEAREKKEKRQKRFQNDISSGTNTPSEYNSSYIASTPVDDDDDNVHEPFVGRSTKLEKKYLRLTSAPDPDSVRPLYILKQTLELLKKKWREEQNYAYICDQFKSLRQDLTVQHIQNEFTVLVYEIHSRIALEKSDLGEYNQCQSQLKGLYAQGIDGHEQEFLAYRILYLLHTQNKGEIRQLLVDMKPQVQDDKCIRHALKVCEAMAVRNYHRLFQLYCEAPNMGGYVMDSFMGRERLSALSCMCKAYRPTISLELLTSELGFQDEEECVMFMQSYGVVCVNKGDETNLRFVIDSKEAYIKFEVARQNAFKKVDIRGQI